MSRTITAVAAQVHPIATDPAATFEKFAQQMATLSRSMPQTGLVVFPELYLSAVGSWDAGHPDGYADAVAEPIPGPLTDRIGDVVRRAKKWVVAGTILERAGDRTFNTAIAFDPDGKLVARHRKLAPWKPYESSDPGQVLDRSSTFDIPGVGRFGLMICYEGWFPEFARTLAWMGAEAILQPSLTTTSDRPQELVLARATAIANQCYVVNPNYGGLFGTGRSIVVDPEGTVIAEGGSGEEYLTFYLDLDRVRHVREHGTAGLNMLWKQLRDYPPPAFPPYREGFGAGDVMERLGPFRQPDRPLDEG